MKINKLCDYKGLKIGKPTPKKPSPCPVGPRPIPFLWFQKPTAAIPPSVSKPFLPIPTVNSRWKRLALRLVPPIGSWRR